MGKAGVMNRQGRGREDMTQSQHYAGGQTGPLMRDKSEGSQVIKRKRKLKEGLIEGIQYLSQYFFWLKLMLHNS